jgi:phosphoribosylaminoimidazolecarboxamide formyltransferase/IMP cyclohydrolase
MDLGQRLTRKLSSIFKKKICVLIKHEMPSGVAMDDSISEAFEKAWNCDPLSNFGSVDVFSHTLDEDTARMIVEGGRNIEVVYAPDFTPGAMTILQTRKPLRIVKMGGAVDSPSIDKGIEFKRVAGGLLIQKRFDSRIVSPDSIDIVSERKPSREEINAAIFNWTVACFTRSNAVIIGKENKIHGIGSGQRSRIDAAEDAIKFSRRGYGPEGCVMASDAFMPFSDVVELAGKNGISAIIYPLGSVRDQEVIDKANELNIAMIITKKPGETDSERCFLHR